MLVLMGQVALAVTGRLVVTQAPLTGRQYTSAPVTPHLEMVAMAVAVQAVIYRQTGLKK
jgi:hypothetical protein